jgi:FKBP-type peptidyl-prolyl cis-trans isomerase 2
MPESHADTAPLKAGDLVLLDYELWAEGPDHPELVDTTREEVARKAEAKLPEGHRFQAQPHLIGGEFFPAGIEAALVGARLEEDVRKEFAPGEAFGERDPKLIELFSRERIARLPEMRREDAELHIGTALTIDGRRGRVTLLTAGRVRVDFNPELAGRKIRGEFKALKRIEAPVERATAVIDLTYGHGQEFDVKVHDGIVTLKVPERTKFDFAWTVAKPRLIDQMRSRLAPKAIHIVEEYVTPAAGEKAEGAAHAPASGGRAKGAAKGPKPEEPPASA